MTLAPGENDLQNDLHRQRRCIGRAAREVVAERLNINLMHGMMPDQSSLVTEWQDRGRRRRLATALHAIMLAQLAERQAIILLGKADDWADPWNLAKEFEQSSGFYRDNPSQGTNFYRWYTRLTRYAGILVKRYSSAILALANEKLQEPPVFVPRVKRKPKGR